MGYICDFCGEQKSVVHCRSDAASLCLSCDRNVHSANALSRRHFRTLLCERCNTHPALVRCIQEKVSLCPNCDLIGHSSNSTGTSSMHKRQPVNSYSGCPSSAELSTIWPFFSEVSSVGGDAPNERVMSLMTINEGSPDDQESEGKDNIQDASVAVEMATFYNIDKSNKSMWSSGIPHDNSKLPNVEQSTGTTFAGGSKVFYPGIKGSNFYEDDAFYDNFNMDEVDLSIQDYEFVGMGLDDPDLFADDQIDGLFGMDISGADSNCQDTHAVEGSSTGHINAIQPAYSNAASADSIMSCKTEPNLRFTKQGHSSLSFSGLTGESSAGDYQDCGASSMLLMGEPPWGPPCPENSLPSSSRSNAVMRYKEKKKSRKFEKKVRYESRKARADIRRRVKGRFVKAGDAYDYDPLSQTRSY